MDLAVQNVTAAFEQQKYGIYDPAGAAEMLLHMHRNSEAEYPSMFMMID